MIPGNIYLYREHQSAQDKSVQRTSICKENIYLYREHLSVQGTCMCAGSRYVHRQHATKGTLHFVIISYVSTWL